MKLYSVIQYRLIDYTGIQYIESYKLLEQSFMLFIQNTSIYSISFNLNGQQIHHQLSTINEFYDGLYKDIINNRYYIISCIDI